MKSLIILTFLIMVYGCKQNEGVSVKSKEKIPTIVTPNTAIPNAPSITEDNEPSVPNEANLELEFNQLKEEILEAMVVLGEHGTWKLKFLVNDHVAKIDTDLLFKLRFTNLNLLPENVQKLISDLEALREKLLQWREEYSRVGEIDSFAKDNDVFESYLTLFKRGSESLAKKLIFETDNYFHICSLGNQGLEDERYFPIISFKRVFPEKSCQELYQFFNNEYKAIKLEAGSDYHFTSLQALRGFFNITELSMRGSYESLLDGELDISILQEMKYLKFFESGYNKIRDLSPLARLKRLTFISIYPVEEYKYLKVCPTDSENKTLNEFCKKAGFPK